MENSVVGTRSELFHLILAGPTARAIQTTRINIQEPHVTLFQLGNVRVARGYFAAFQVSHNGLSEICGEGETLADAVGYLIRRLTHMELEWAQAEGGDRMEIVQDVIADLWRFDELAVRRNSQAASTTQRPRCQTTMPSETERKAPLFGRL